MYALFSSEASLAKAYLEKSNAKDSAKMDVEGATSSIGAEEARQQMDISQDGEC